MTPGSKETFFGGGAANLTKNFRYCTQKGILRILEPSDLRLFVLGEWVGSLDTQPYPNILRKPGALGRLYGHVLRFVVGATQVVVTYDV